MGSPTVEDSLIGQRQRMVAAGGDHDSLDADRHFHRRRDAFRWEVADAQLAVAVAPETVNLPVRCQ